MKRVFLLMILLFSLFVMTGCSDSSMAKGKKLSVATDRFPVYDFLVEVFEKEMDITLVKSQQDENAKKADLFICINSDGFSENTFEIKKEVELDGENVWVSPQKAIDAFYAVYNKIISLDSGLEEKVKDKYDNYVVSLQNLNTKMKTEAQGKSIIIADDVNLDVLKKDYGFNIRTLDKNTGSVVALVSEMKKENLDAVYYLKGGSNEAANVAGNMVSSYVLPIDLCEIKNFKEIKNNLSYLKMLENNAKNFSVR